jgi:hypothetical protein
LDVFDRGIKVPVCDHYNLPVPTPEAVVEGTSRLIPGFGRDLNHQAALTQVLETAEPEVNGFFDKASEVLDWVESSSGLPVKYLSAGPTAAEKRVR